MPECTKPEDSNRVFSGGTVEPQYTDEQNLALILEQHKRQLRVLSDEQLSAVEASVSESAREWAARL